FVGMECADVGIRGRGGHGHNDALALEVALNGHDILVDTGCASYTASLRDRVYCISARSHNVPVVGGEEPATIITEGVPHATACAVSLDAWHASPTEDAFGG